MLLNLALINYALSFLVRRGFTPVQTPFFMRKARARCFGVLGGASAALTRAYSDAGARRSA